VTPKEAANLHRTALLVSPESGDRSPIRVEEHSQTLAHEKFLYLARAGPYADAARPMALLAERVEGLVSQEHAAWVSEQREDAAVKGTS
jgi:hypothetical protein